MRSLRPTALSAHLASSVLVVGTFFVLLLAGPSGAPTACRWEGAMVVWGRHLLLVALGSGIVWLLVRTALFEGRAQAALEPRAVLHAVLDTWPGLVWLARHGILVILAAFLAIRSDLTERRDWIAARVEALAPGALALALMSASSHAAAISPGTALTVAIDACHLLGTGVWLGGLVALGALLRAASRDADADDRAHAVITARRFSRVALVAMLALMGSGVLNALAQVENIAALVGTPHGRLLLAKVAVLVPILGLAAVNRRRLLPALPGPEAMRRLVAFVGVEAMLALVLLVLAAAMTLTTPARHAEPVWPLPVRLSLDTPLGVNLAPSCGRALLARQPRPSRTRHAGLREPPRGSAAVGRDQFHQGARHRRRLEKPGSPGPARWRLADRPRLHHLRRPAGPGGAARLPRAADGPPGAVYPAGIPRAHLRAGPEVQPAVDPRCRDHRRTDADLRGCDQGARRVATCPVPGGNRRQRRDHRHLRYVRLGAARGTPDRPSGLRPRDLERRHRRDPGAGGEAQRGKERPALPGRPRPLRRFGGY